MSQLRISQLADAGEETYELFWFTGLLQQQDDWFIKTFFLNEETGSYIEVPLPIGLLPMLTPGKAFQNGEMLTLPMRGVLGREVIRDLSQYDEVESSEIPQELYSFGSARNRVQHLFRYYTHDSIILVPTIELLRYLFLHNRTLANAVLRPGALSLLFSPVQPGFQHDLHLRFTSEMPKRCISDQFVQEFAWLAVNPEGRKSWDSVYTKTKGQRYVSFDPPPLRDSAWTFRGLQFREYWLVLELLSITGKQHPCINLTYQHPSLKDPSYGCSASIENSEQSLDTDDGRDTERVRYDYVLDDGLSGARTGDVKVHSDFTKQSSFTWDLPVRRLLVNTGRQAANSERRPNLQSSSSGQVVEIRKRVVVSAGERNHGAQLPPLEFRLLTPANLDDLDDLQALAKTARVLSELKPELGITMAACKLKAGRKFSMPNRNLRLCLVVLINRVNAPPIVLLDVQRIGEIALSVTAMHFRNMTSFGEVEERVKLVLDRLVDASGHWDLAVESELNALCSFEHYPKLLTPRSDLNVPGQVTLWAKKLLNRLGLDR